MSWSARSGADKVAENDRLRADLHLAAVHLNQTFNNSIPATLTTSVNEKMRTRSSYFDGLMVANCSYPKDLVAISGA
jgi:hypothetical protein